MNNSKHNKYYKGREVRNQTYQKTCAWVELQDQVIRTKFRTGFGSSIKLYALYKERSETFLKIKE